MLNAYKRFVLWNCRMTAKVPGFKRYGRFMERQYTKRFWTTVMINMAIGQIIMFYVRRMINRRMQIEVIETTPVVKPCSSCGSYRGCLPGCRATSGCGQNPCVCVDVACCSGVGVSPATQHDLDEHYADLRDEIDWSDPKISEDWHD